MISPSASKVQNLKSALLEGLNLEQQEAVLTTEGPILVIAGAGTGKTRVIAHRIAYLLATKPSLTPQQVLALTFSKKASEEMLERVENLLGTYAGGLQLSTFHSFCHQFLQDHAGELGLPIRFRLLDRAESWVFFRKLLPELKLTHFWNFAEPTECIHGFLRFISRAKDELVSPQDYASRAHEIPDLRERAKAEEIARVYETYQKQMKKAGVLDFGDLLVETFRALKERPPLLEELRTRTPYLLIDEFQDTNVAQIALLELLAAPDGNLCVVGDDDQAIYRFRGASFASFLLVQKAFPKMKTIRLTRNYRSTQNILSATNRLIQHNLSDRFDPNKSLWTENEKGAPVEIIVCKSESDEAFAVVRSIRNIVAHQSDSPRFDEIAVLYRAHVHKNRVVDALQEAHIPFVVIGGVSLFDQGEIKDLCAYLRILRDPSDSVSLFRILSHAVWGLPVQELLILTDSAKEQGICLYEALKTAPKLLKEATSVTVIQKILEELSFWRKRALRDGVGTWIPRFAEESALSLVFKLPEERSQESLVSLGRFLRFVYRYVENEPKAQDLPSFLWYLDSYRLAEEEPASEDDLTVGNQVRLTTVHQAKGLEFKWVIVLGMIQGRFPSRSRLESIPFPTELMKEPLPEGDYHLQEERRLCYVACTRAQRGLILLTQERAYHRTSPFIREMHQGASSDEIKSQLEKESEPSPHSEPLSHQGEHSSLAAEREAFQVIRKIRELDLKDETGLEEAIRQMTEIAHRLHKDKEEQESVGPQRSSSLSESSKLSYTQIETYRYCPLKYKFSYLYKIPTRPTPQMTFGVDLHACLEWFFTQVIKGTVPPLEGLLKKFQELHSPERYGESYQDQKYLHLGLEILTDFYKRHDGSFISPIFLEKPFVLNLGPSWIRGVIDRIDPLPEGGVEIIDYKSGKPKEEAAAEEQLQLRLYALATKETLQLEPRRVSFYYLKNNQKLSFDQKPEDFELTRGQLIQRTEAIRSGNFTPTPSVVKCRRCDFQNLCPSSMA